MKYFILFPVIILTVISLVSCEHNVYLDEPKNDENIVQHRMTYCKRTEATCTTAGTREFWYCIICGKYYADSNGNAEISEESTVIHPTGHEYRISLTGDDKKHWHECMKCHVHEDDIPHTGNQFIYDDDNHIQICSECGLQFNVSAHQWGKYHECDCEGPVKHMVTECKVCNAVKNASTPDYLLFDIGIGEAKLKAIESTPCGDFFINGAKVSNGLQIRIYSPEVTVEFRPHLNSNINYSPYCYVNQNGSMDRITTGTKDEKGIYKVNFTLNDRKEHGVNIQANTEGGSISTTCYLRLKEIY